MHKREMVEAMLGKIEQAIRREPTYWLWSHKRWKLNREEAEQQEELNKKKEQQ